MPNKVLLLHGITSSPKVFEEFKKDLEEKGINSFSPKLLGHRLNIPRANEVRLHNYEHESDEYLNYLTDLGNKKITIIGQSFGALLALRLAIKNPNLVNKLILISLPLDFRQKKVRTALSIIEKIPYSITEKLPGLSKSAVVENHSNSVDSYQITSLKILSELKNKVSKELSQLSVDTTVYQNVNDYHLNPYSGVLLKNKAKSNNLNIKLRDYGNIHTLINLSEVRGEIINELTN